MPVMTNAAKNGPIKTEAGERTHTSRGLLKGRRPAPSSESTYGISTSHVPAKAITKKKTSGWRASRPLEGEAACTGGLAAVMSKVLFLAWGGGISFPAPVTRH